MRRVFILALFAMLAVGGGRAESSPDRREAARTFGAVADAHVSAAAPRRNFGRGRVLLVGTRTRAYVRFQVRGLTEPVSRATLRVFARTSSRRGLTVRTTSARWSERRITQRNAPRAGRSAGASPRLQRGRWLSVDVTSAVPGNGSVNLLLSGRGSASISSREGGRRPQLIVETEPPLPPATLVAAGDIADGSPFAAQTAALVDAIPGTVAAIGDLAYENGTASDFATKYEPTWGRFKSRTRPATGNHEYQDPAGGAAGYFGYFGAAAGTPGQGWYSYELGAWHVVVLNSNCSFVGGCQAGSPQHSFLVADLAAHKNRCTLAYWHHPRLSSGFVGGSSSVAPLWEALYNANADVVLVGHAHNYQRWKPAGPTGAQDPARGIREFVVGTGGRNMLHDADPQLPGQDVINDTTFGVLRMTLRPTGYDWQFVGIPGSTFTDSGSGACH